MSNFSPEDPRPEISTFEIEIEILQHNNEVEMSSASSQGRPAKSEEMPTTS